jgi:hypothetical protein
MKIQDKYKLYTITFIIDLFLIYSLLNSKIVSFDFIFIIITLCLHIIFYYSLHTYDKEVIDILHYFVFLLPLFSIFTSLIYIKISCLFLITIIQCLWIFEDRCIMNEPSDDFGFGILPSFYSLFLTIFLSLNIGYTYKI